MQGRKKNHSSPPSETDSGRTLSGSRNTRHADNAGMLQKASKMRKGKGKKKQPKSALSVRVISRASYNKRRHNIFRWKCDFQVDSTTLIRWESKEEHITAK